jgi:NADH:ubiquinone oxidoreductase subunit E
MNGVNLDVSQLDTDKLAKLDAFIATQPDGEGSLINILHHAQHLFGYIPTNLQLYIARKLNIGAAKVNGVVSFYSYFSQEKTGRHVVSVCMGTACYVKGAGDVLNEFLKQLHVQKNEVTQDELFSVRDVRCVGACGLAPVVTIGDKVYGHVSREDVKRILNDIRGGVQ